MAFTLSTIHKCLAKFAFLFGLRAAAFPIALELILVMASSSRFPGLLPHDCPTNSWPSLGKRGRAWAPARFGRNPQCFVCGWTLMQHNEMIRVSKDKETGIVDMKPGNVFCYIPQNSSKFCDQSCLRDSWTRGQNSLYKQLVVVKEELQKSIERVAAR